MSVIARYSAECDMCGNLIVDEIEDEYDIDQEVRDAYGTDNITVGYTDYEHVCEGCMEEITYCTWCEDGEHVHYDNAHYCGDFTFIDDHDCSINYHTQLVKDEPQRFDARECKDCGYELEDLPRDFAHPPLVRL